MMNESEQRQFDALQNELDNARISEERLIETIKALREENEVLWNLLDVMKKRIKTLS